MASLRLVCLLTATLHAAGCTARQVFFSGDTDLEAVVVGEIDAASSTVDVAIYTFTAENIQNALIDAAGRGVAVQVVMDARQTTDPANEGQAAVRINLREAGVPVRTAEGFNGGILHHKFVVIDDGTVVTGSYNFTLSANNANDENLLVLNDPNLARAYDEAFQDLWARATE